MIDERDDAVSEMGRLLAIDPSPEFAVKVRAGVQALGHERSEPGRPWVWGLLAVVAMSLVVIGLGHVREHETSTAQVIDRILPAARISQTTPMVAPEVPRPALHRPSARPPSLAPVQVPAETNSPDLSVVTDQGAMLGWIWTTAAAGGNEARVVAKSADASAEDAALLPIQVSEIVSTPIVIAQIDTGPGDFGN